MNLATESIVRLLVAALLGSIIGLERERLNWMAGLRTHMLVCVGAALVMLVSAFGFSDVLDRSNIVLDPSRVAAQVVSGIGFLGAGVILLRGDILRGVNTAASLWSVSGIGLAVGGGMYVPAVGATVIILLILAGIKPLERRLAQGHAVQDLEISAETDSVGLRQVRDALEGERARLKGFALLPAGGPAGLDRIDITLEHASEDTMLRVEMRLRGVRGVRDCRRGGQGAAPVR